MAHDAAVSTNRGGRNRHRVRGRQAAKRATFPFINSQIISVAESGNLALTVSTIESFVPEMNLVNISTALHRLAKLTANDLQAQLALRQHPVLAALLEAACRALERAKATGTSPHCQALSNITWALATVQHADVGLLEMVAELSHLRVESFKPFELSATLWAFAKLDSVEPAACRCADALFRAAAEYIPSHAELFSFRCLVMTSWAFASARHYDGRLFRGIAARMVPMVQTANTQELANSAWAFSTAGVRHERLLAELARKALQQMADFKPQELANMLWALAAGGFFHEEFFVNAAHAIQFVELQAQQMANVLWALSRLRPRHPAAQAALLALLPRCSWMLEAFKPQELASVALAAAKCFGRQGAGEPGLEPVGQAAVPAQVAGFFIAALPRVLPRVHSFSGQSLANLLWSSLSVRAGHDTEVLPEIAREAARRAAELESSALLLLLRNLPAVRNSVCDGAARALFAEAARRVDALRPRELQVLSRICAGLLGLPRAGDRLAASAEEVRRCCKALSEAASWTVSPLEDADCQDDTLLEAAAGRAGEPAPRGAGSGGPAEAVEIRLEGALDPEAASQTPEREAPQPVRRGSAGNADAMSVLTDRVQYSVKNTFLHVDDDDELDSEGEDGDDPAKHLPPSLGIIPDSVSPEKLAAYRADYQRFRAGKAVGAKGELSSSVQPVEEESPLSPRADPGEEALPEASPYALKLPPPLEFMPRYISLEKLEVYRKDYQRFRAGNTTGAKGEISNHVAQDAQATTPVARLPPPLDIIPHDVSPQKLEAYRMDYQRFRAGNAVGAKGEVGSAVGRGEPHFIALDKLATCRPGRLAPRRPEAPGAAWPCAAQAPTAAASEPAPPPAPGGGASGSGAPPQQTTPRGGAKMSEECDAASPGSVKALAEAGAWPEVQVAFSVKNTFIHFAAACDDPEDCEPDGQESMHVAKLPPPLKIIPDDVCAEKLEAYRMDYQKFRAGNAVGAKGEVASSVAEDP